MNGFIVYDGPSLIGDKLPVVAIVTGTIRATKNKKTGDILQLWILPRDMSPISALVQDENSSVCGNCPLQGHRMKDRKCYVNVGQSPQQVWRAYQRGNYPEMARTNCNQLLHGRKIRLGAYGDPAALPLPILRWLVTKTIAQTGYSHSMLDIPSNRADSLAELVMFSADTPEQHERAIARGWRSFLMVPIGYDYSASHTIACPAMSGRQCADCMLCCGTSRKARSIWIEAHGKQGKSFSWEV